MKRQALLSCGLVLAGAALGSGADWTPQATRAAAADCAWNRHAKRVVKHVRRHGKPRRAVRTRHWWSCDPVGDAPPLPAPTPGLAPPAQQPEPEANRVGVGAHDQNGDLGYVLTRPQVRAGRVTVELDNNGEDPHNLNLQRQGGGEPVYQLANTLPSHHEVASFELAAGTYRLWCSLPEHDEKGMHTTLVVEAP
jgi:plastocyanin